MFFVKIEAVGAIQIANRPGWFGQNMNSRWNSCRSFQSGSTYILLVEHDVKKALENSFTLVHSVTGLELFACLQKYFVVYSIMFASKQFI
jgi:hypothetical protein